MRKLVIVLAVLVVAGWSAAWLYASREAGRRVDDWIKAEATQGRVWTCPNRSIGGYPLAITIACSDPTFSGRGLGQVVDGSLAALAAELSLLHPRTIALTLRAPFAYRTSDGETDIIGRWSSLHVSLGALPDLRTLTLRGTDVSVQGLFGQSGQQGGSAARLDAMFTHEPSAADPTIDFAIAVDAMPIPSLDAVIGGGDPYDVALNGRLDRADVGDARTPEDAMEQWRRAGGRIDLGDSRLTRGQSSVTASGTLGLDEAHRPRGRLAAQFVGLEPILQRFGISGNLAAAGSLLSSLFGGGPKPSAPAVPGALSLPISFQNGRLGVGPIRTGVALPPLY